MRHVESRLIEKKMLSVVFEYSDYIDHVWDEPRTDGPYGEKNPR